MCAGGFLCLSITSFLIRGSVWLLIPPISSLIGHHGSAAARVFKLFRTEHGELFNVSSSSEWVQGEELGTPW